MNGLDAGLPIRPISDCEVYQSDGQCFIHDGRTLSFVAVKNF